MQDKWEKKQGLNQQAATHSPTTTLSYWVRVGKIQKDKTSFTTWEAATKCNDPMMYMIN